MSVAAAVAGRQVSHNLVNKSAFVSYSRKIAFLFGTVYGACKMGYLMSYVKNEDHKKVEQIQEAQIDIHTLRGQAFHHAQIYDPEYTKSNLEFRDNYPDYYLHPNDEFVYQTVTGRKRDQQVRDEIHAEAVEFLKAWKAAEGK